MREYAWHHGYLDVFHFRYYGENVLHMSCVAEDPSVVKWLLDIGADIDRCRRKYLQDLTYFKERIGFCFWMLTYIVTECQSEQET